MSKQDICTHAKDIQCEGSTKYSNLEAMSVVFNFWCSPHVMHLPHFALSVYFAGSLIFFPKSDLRAVYHHCTL